MVKIRPWVVPLNLLVLLAYMGYAVYSKEKLLEEGTLILLELAPVDPRSLMQGDYMRLNYAVSVPDSSAESLPKRGYCVVELDAAGVAHRKRFQEEKQPLGTGEYLIRYNRPRHAVNIGAESFFFEEGKAGDFAGARYGGIRTDPSGNTILIGLFDKNRKQIH